MLSSMACTPGRGRMAVMERLLSSGSAVEPSSDMHVFDQKPLTDPLNLVSCKSCKKPMKASQYAAHAERCRSISTSDDIGLEIDGGTGHKRPPRKARKKVQTAHDNQATGAGDQEISESFDGDSAASESANVDDSQTGLASALGREVKKSSTSVDGSLTVDGPGVGAGSASYSEGAMSPSKRAKLQPLQSSVTSEELDSVCGVTTESGTCCQGPLTCMLHSESSKRAVKGRRQLYDVLLGEHNAKLVHGHDPKNKDDHVPDIPVPLATKIYYPRQNQRLRAVIGHLYRESLNREKPSDSSIPKSLPGDSGVHSGNMQILSPDNDLPDQKRDLMVQKKMHKLKMKKLNQQS